MSKLAVEPKTRDLAEMIYTELLSGAAEVSAEGAKFKTEPAKLAAISFKLATAFNQEEDRLNAENLPKNQDFKLGVEDFAKWSK